MKNIFKCSKETLIIWAFFVLAIKTVAYGAEASIPLVKAEWNLDSKNDSIALKITNQGIDAIKISPNATFSSILINMKAGELPIYPDNSIVYPSILFILNSNKNHFFTGTYGNGRVMPPITVASGETKTIQYQFEPEFIAIARNSTQGVFSLVYDRKVINVYKLQHTEDH